MFYNSGWKSGFFTGLITGVAIYAMAKTPRGRNVLDKVRGVTNIVKDEVYNMSRQATDVLDSTVKVADNLSRQEAAGTAAGSTYTPGGSYSASNI
jgi:hypothetical protein